MKTLLLDREVVAMNFLRQQQGFDAEAEKAFTDLMHLAAQICQAPIALISFFIQDQYQWIKFAIGVALPQLPKDVGLCALAGEKQEIVIVTDTLDEPQFAQNAMVMGYPHVRSLVAAPLISPSGQALGSLCVMNSVPQTPSLQQVEALLALSRQVVSQLELRRNLSNLPQNRQQAAALWQAVTQTLHLARAIPSTSDGVLITDPNQPDNPIIYANPAFSHLTGYEPDEIIGRNCRFLQGIDTDPQTVAEMRQAISAMCNSEGTAQGQEIKVTLLNYRKGGQPFWNELRISPVFSDEGELLYFVGIQTDVSERKRAETALQYQAERERLIAQSAQRIRQSLDLNDILNTTVSEVRQFLQADRVFIYRFEADWSGVIAVESVQFEYSSILGSKIRDSFFGKKLGRKLYQKGRIQAVDDIEIAQLSECHKNLLRSLQIRANLVVPILQEEKLWGLLVANHCSAPRPWQQLEIDLLRQLATQVAIAIQQAELYQQLQRQLQDRVQAEQKIREQAALLDITTDAIMVRNLDHQILFWNRGAEKLYGWQADEVIARDAKQFLYNGTLPQFQIIEAALAREGHWQGELHESTKDDRQIIVESRWTLMRDAKNRPKSILIVNTDITEKKSLEAQFLRTQRLESLGTLASGIAHDLNNILAPILMSVQLLQSKLPDPKDQQLVNSLERNVQRGAALIKQVLSFARGAEARFTLLQAKSLILEIADIAQETFPRSILVSTDIVDNLWTVMADSVQLHQVLMNLCVNARDAMPNGGHLKLSAQNLLIDENFARMNLNARIGPFIEITVSDTGIGVPAEILDRIFEPFFTTKEMGEGNGLGLSTVMGIIKSHQGFIIVNSEVEAGTQFKVYLPATDVPATASVSSDLTLLTGHDELILVVDDESTIREVTRASLVTYGYQAITASDGIEAIAQYAQHQTDIKVVLLDMMMPSMDGPMTVRMLKRVNPDVKIIAVSGLVSNFNIVTSPDSGINRFLIKPYTTKELLKSLSEVLHEH